jgi:RNA polymerase-binding transcription factor DksA
MMTKQQQALKKSLMEWRRQLREHLKALDERERALRLALSEGRIADEGLRELAWERVHELERERWQIEDELWATEEMLERLERSEGNA